MGEELRAIKYTRGSLELLDQRKLPMTVHYDVIDSCEKAWAAIKEMRVRGAPAIAISAALGLAVEVTKTAPPQDVSECAKHLTDRLRYLGTSRPTAVNLHNAVEQLIGVITAEAAKDGATSEKVVTAFLEGAEGMLAADEADCRAIGEHGSRHILAKHCSDGAKARVVTICNTGALACTRYGTALGVVRFLGKAERLERVYPLETRPYNQGSRLTVFECVTEHLPATLIVDSAVSYLMQTTPMTCAIVGADRVALNGDTANKIGTYNVAVSAKHHGVPFYVAAPVTTIDQKIENGSFIPVEERGAEEITHNPATGQRVVSDGPSLNVWNPAFDITPADLITGIITEHGVIEKGPDGKLDVPAFLKGCGKWKGC